MRMHMAPSPHKRAEIGAFTKDPICIEHEESDREATDNDGRNRKPGRNPLSAFTNL